MIDTTTKRLALFNFWVAFGSFALASVFGLAAAFGFAAAFLGFTVFSTSLVSVILKPLSEYGNMLLLSYIELYNILMKVMLYTCLHVS